MWVEISFLEIFKSLNIDDEKNFVGLEILGQKNSLNSKYAIRKKFAGRKICGEKNSLIKNLEVEHNKNL